MLTREQVKQKWIEIIEAVHKERVFSSVDGAWQLAQWVERQREEADVYLALLGQVHAAISFETEEEARASKYGLPADLAQSIYLAVTRGFVPSGNSTRSDELVTKLAELEKEAEAHRVDYNQRSRDTEQPHYWRGRRDEAGHFRDKLTTLINAFKNG